MKVIIQQHLAKYPYMQAQDIYKLLYQSAFAGGHMIASPEKSLAFLCEEVAQIDTGSEQALFEEIGNDLIRLNLKALAYHSITVEEINDVFVESANSHKSDMMQFEQMLNMLHFQEFEIYRAGMKLKGYPMVSHSSIYKAHYDPHYRVVSVEVFQRMKPELTK